MVDGLLLHHRYKPGDVTDSNRLNTNLPADGRQQLDGPAEDQAHA